MSEQQNTQIVKDAYAAFGRGDIQSLIKACADDVEWVLPGEGLIPQSGTYRGHGGVGRFFEKLAQSLEFSSFEPRTFVAQGDTVVAQGYYRGKAKQTGKSFESEWAMAFTIRDGKVSKFREYTDTATIASAYAAAKAA
jgi:uncharacterized protein